MVNLAAMNPRRTPAPEGPFDVAIVGAGAVGCAVARELSLRGASCILIEAGPDVGAGTSKANTAILHTGFDAKPGTIESGLVARGYELLTEYAAEVGIPTAKLGALMIAWSGEQREALAGVEANARENGYEDARRVDLEELYAREPNIGPGAEGRSGDPGRGDRLPVHRHPRLRHRGAGAGCELVMNAAVSGVRRAAAATRSRRRGARSAPRPGQRRRAAQRRGRRDARPLRVPRHAEARGADRLRQARPGLAQPRPAAGPHGEDQGRAGLADGLRQRPARADRRRRRGQDGPLDHRDRPGVPDGGRRADPARARASTR